MASLKVGLRLETLARNGALDEAVRVGLGSVDLGVLAGVLETLMPGEICAQLVSVLPINGVLLLADLPISK